MAIKLSTAILLMIVFIGAVTIVVLLVGGDDGASGSGFTKVFADDNENDLGLCLNYHQQNACDRADIKMYTDQLLAKAEECNNMNNLSCLAENDTDGDGCDFDESSCSDIIAPQIGAKH